jgi:hypothetical protein
MRNEIQCTYALSVEDNCLCNDCVQRRNLNNAPQPVSEQLRTQQEHHQDQFDIATQAAIQRGFGRWFDDTWNSAKANGALPNPFISSIFVFTTTVLLKKFLNGLSKDMPPDHKEQAIADAKRMMVGYLDQIEAAAIKDIYSPHPPESESTITPKGNKQTLIMPRKKRFRH